MMKRDKVVFENEKFEVTGYDIWMTAGEIASLFGVTIMKVRSIINRMRRQLTVNLDLLSKYDLLESGYMDELYNLECIICVSYYVDTGLQGTCNDSLFLTVNPCTDKRKAPNGINICQSEAFLFVYPTFIGSATS